MLAVTLFSTPRRKVLCSELRSFVHVAHELPVNWCKKSWSTLGLASGPVVSLVILLVPITQMPNVRPCHIPGPSDSKPRRSGEERARARAAVRPSQHLISPSSDLSLLPMRFIGCSLLVWALVTRRAAPDIPVRSTGLFPTNTATARSAPILHIPLLGVRMPGI